MLPKCRAGYPGHFGEPWSNFDDAEIDFVIQYKHLTDAGYNGPVCIEVEDRAFERSIEDRKRSLQQSKKFLEQFVA